MRIILKMSQVCVTAIVLLPSLSYAQSQSENADEFLRQNKSTVPALQQDADNSNGLRDEIKESIALAKSELEDKETLSRKIALAKEMHKIRPTRDQVDSAVRKASQGLPPAQRQGFIDGMRSVLNYNAIERISVDAMIETYTLKELEAMVAYYGTPEAKSAGIKVGVWGARVQPEVIRMIDKAMMRIRTGGN